MEILKYFKVELLTDTVQRIQMTDEVYFGPLYAHYISNSKMGLLCPSQGGSPQKFLAGFKASNSSALALGSAVHQLTLEKEIYALSPITKPSGKLGLAYEEYLAQRKRGKRIEEAMTLASKNADYYFTKMKEYKGNGLPGFVKTALAKCAEFHNLDKKETEDGKTIIYLPSDQYKKCVGCVASMDNNVAIQKELQAPNGHCEDVILCEVRVTFPKDFGNPSGEQHEVIVPLKMKADHWRIDHEEKLLVLNDVKTTGKPVQYFMGYEIEEPGFLGQTVKKFIPGSFTNFHYARQMGMYMWLLKHYVNKEHGEGYKCKANMLVVETVGAHNSKLYPVTAATITQGFREFGEMVKRVAYHMANGYEAILELENPNNF